MITKPKSSIASASSDPKPAETPEVMETESATDAPSTPVTSASSTAASVSKTDGELLARHESLLVTGNT